MASGGNTSTHSEEVEPSHRYADFATADEVVTKGYYWRLRNESRDGLQRMETRLDDTFTETQAQLTRLDDTVGALGQQMAQINQALTNINNRRLRSESRSSRHPSYQPRRSRGPSIHGDTSDSHATSPHLTGMSRRQVLPHLVHGAVMAILLRPLLMEEHRSTIMATPPTQEEVNFITGLTTSSPIWNIAWRMTIIMGIVRTRQDHVHDNHAKNNIMRTMNIWRIPQCLMVAMSAKNVLNATQDQIKIIIIANEWMTPTQIKNGLLVLLFAENDMPLQDVRTMSDHIVQEMKIENRTMIPMIAQVMMKATTMEDAPMVMEEDLLMGMARIAAVRQGKTLQTMGVHP